MPHKDGEFQSDEEAYNLGLCPETGKPLKDINLAPYANMLYGNPDPRDARNAPAIRRRHAIINWTPGAVWASVIKGL